MTALAEIDNTQARINITYAGANGDLPDPVLFNASDTEVKSWVTEAVRTGSVPGIPADLTASFADYVIDRFAATEARPYALLQARPKTPFGNAPWKYELLWRNKFLTIQATSIDDMISDLSAAVETLKAMKVDGVILNSQGGTRDDYASLVTDDSTVATKYGMSLWDDAHGD